MAMLFESFGTKEVGCASQIGFSKNKNPTQPSSKPPSPNNFFEYKMWINALYKASLLMLVHCGITI